MNLERPRRIISRGFLCGTIGSAAILGALAAGGAAADSSFSATMIGQDSGGEERSAQRQRQREGTSRIDEMLDRMTGNWTVEVKLSPDRFGPDGYQTTTRRPRGTDRMPRERPGSDRSADERREAPDGPMTVEGFATIRGMLGDTMIRERFFTDDERLMPGRADRAARRERMREQREQRAQRGGDRERTGDRPERMEDGRMRPHGDRRRGEDRPGDQARLAGVAWFDLDPRAEEYTAVFIGNGTDAIRHTVGRLDTSGRRIVFRDLRELHDRGAGVDPRNGPVVLEWTSADEFTVTMYADRGVQSRTAGDRGMRDDPMGGGRGLRDQPRGDRDAEGEDGWSDRMVYRATYTRTSESESKDMDERINDILAASGG